MEAQPSLGMGVQAHSTCCGVKAFQPSSNKGPHGAPASAASQGPPGSAALRGGPQSHLVLSSLQINTQKSVSDRC